MNKMKHPLQRRLSARIAIGLCTVAVLVAVPLVSAALPSGTSGAAACTPPAPTPTAPSPTPTRNPTPPPPPPPVERLVTLAASKGLVDFGGSVSLTGELTSLDGTCRPGEKVRVMSKDLGSDVERAAGGATTDSNGAFTIGPKVRASAIYWAVAEVTKDAAEAVSEPVTVLNKVSIEAHTRTESPERGTKFEINAEVRPEHPGSSAVLQRKKDDRWVKVKTDKANSKSEFKFKIEAKWKGKRLFRVTWLKSHEDHEPDTSGKIKIKPVEPRDDGGRGGRDGGGRN